MFGCYRLWAAWEEGEEQAEGNCRGSGWFGCQSGLYAEGRVVVRGLGMLAVEVVERLRSDRIEVEAVVLAAVVAESGKGFGIVDFAEANGFAGLGWQWLRGRRSEEQEDGSCSAVEIAVRLEGSIAAVSVEVEIAVEGVAGVVCRNSG